MGNIKKIDYYGLDVISKEKINSFVEAAVTTLQETKFDADAPVLTFLAQVYDNPAVCDLLIYLSRLPVFETEFAHALSHDLDLLAILKKLKYFTNLPLGQSLLLIQQVALKNGKVLDNYNEAFLNIIKNQAEISLLKFKDYVTQQQATLTCAAKYIENNAALETIDPHAVYPTSIYRHSNGLTLASSDSQTIEAVMSTTLTTTIKITRGVLDYSNDLLASVYQPLGRCVAVVDDKVIGHYGDKLKNYFNHFGIDLVLLIHGGNEIDKDIKHVEEILIELKRHNVARNEPVLIMGGGVIADIGGFATALYHRNTPYVMLCTSIVTGIDAGPSPRTCCDGFGFKNLYGAYHPPVLTLTDRAFWKTLHEGWIRHGIAEIIKMAVVEDKSLFELIEKAGPRLITTKFGTEGDVDEEFEELCDLIVGKAMEGYVRSEYGNLWETHQCRPHAYGHNWSPGYELPAGMLHGHAVATCMGYGAYLAKLENFVTDDEFKRIITLISNMELSLWHDIMDNHDLVESSNIKVQSKRGGNLCAPVPKTLGRCGYINELSREKLSSSLNEYKAICKQFPRQGKGVQVHCHEVGLEDPSTVAQGAYEDIGQQTNNTSAEKDKTPKPANKPLPKPTEGEISTIGALESQFLKLQCLIKGAKTCLDIGTLTGTSAIALAEGVPANGQVVTLEGDIPTAELAREKFEGCVDGDKIKLIVGSPVQEMEKLHNRGDTFDVIFMDAQKEDYIDYYNLAMEGLLKEDGIIIVANSFEKLKDTIRPELLDMPEFNKYVQGDKRVEQVVLTVKQGLTIIRRVAPRIVRSA